MKFALGFLLAWALMGSAQAMQRTPEQVKRECFSIGQTAHHVMSLRQVSRPKADMMKEAGTSELYKMIVENAYEYPIYNDVLEMIEQIENFQRSWYDLCMTYHKEPLK